MAMCLFVGRMLVLSAVKIVAVCGRTITGSPRVDSSILLLSEVVAARR